MDLMEGKPPEGFSKQRRSTRGSVGPASDDENNVGKKNGLPSVFIGNLDPDVSVATLQALFASFGEVRSCSIGRKTNKAFATVHLVSSTSVTEAVDKLNGTQFNGRALHVEPYNKQKKKAGKNKEEGSQEAKIPQSAKKDSLKPGPFGTPKKTALHSPITSAATGFASTPVLHLTPLKITTPSRIKQQLEQQQQQKSDGVTAIHFSEQKQRTSAISPLTSSPAAPTFIPSAVLQQQQSGSPGSPSRLLSSDLYPVNITNIPPTTTRTKLRALFTPFGEVKKLKLNQGRGVVWFDQLAKATAAATSLKGTVLDGELLSFEARLPKPIASPKGLSPVLSAHATDPARCLLLAIFSKSAEKLFQGISQSVFEITNAALALHIPIVTADLISDSFIAEPEILSAKVSFTNIATFDVSRDLGVKKAIIDSKRKIVVIVGVETDVSILQTAFGLLEMGHTVFVVADAIATSDADSSPFALDRIRAAGGIITTKRGLINEWAGTVKKAEELKHFRE